MKLIKKIGFGFINIGLIWSLLNQCSCNYLCETCSYEQISPCYFLFVFVGIILIVCGASLLLTPEFKKKRRIKKRKIKQKRK